MGFATENTAYRPLKGGRTNNLWRFPSGNETLVCKLYSDVATPLFPNDAIAEAEALNHLSGLDLAPDLCDVIQLSGAHAVVYRYLEGSGWSGSAEPVARLLRKLHSIGGTPQRLLARNAEDLLCQGDQMLLHLPESAANPLKSMRPAPVNATFEQVFLHGDPVPSNIIQYASGVRLIDWQCPAIGDPTEDIALFLSPAMQHLFNGRRLSPEDEEAFLAAYSHPERADRYRALAAIYHWRMAAYCLWKSHHGDRAYQAGYDLETERLE